MKSRNVAIFAVVLLAAASLSRWFAVHSAQWALSTDPEIARQEILMLVPRGTGVDHAKAAMQRAGFKCKLMPDAPFPEHWGESSRMNLLYDPRYSRMNPAYPAVQHRDYLYCDRDTGRERWQVALTYSAGNVTDVFVAHHFGIE